MPRGRGGKRTPKDPAPVSGPGALSERTDGGPGRQEFGNVDPGVQGEAQALEEFQQSAPGQPSPSPQGPAGTAPPQPPINDPGAFTPSERPLEPSGRLPNEDRIVPHDTVPFLRALYMRHPNEDLRRLLEWADRRG